MTHILFVEDSESLGKSLETRLSKEGYSVTWNATLAAAKDALSARTPDLAIVDVMLPDGSGFDFARQNLQPQGIPTIFLSAFTSAEFRLEGFEAGALDYIPKPFHLKELLLRVDRVLKNASGANTKAKSDLALNSESFSIRTVEGHEIFLGKRDFELLKLLVSRSPNPVSREDVQTVVYAGESLNARTIDNAIVRLRQVLGEQTAKRLRSVRGIGYQWVSVEGGD